MSSKTIFCLASSRGRADRILHQLKSEKFSNPGIGVLFYDRTSGNDQIQDWDPVSLLESAESSGPVRGVLAWVSGAGCFNVPGVGRVVAAGPVAAAIKQLEADRTVTTIAHELANLGVAADVAARYERHIRADGDILLSVHATNVEEIAHVRAIFMDSNATEICTSGETLTPPACAIA